MDIVEAARYGEKEDLLKLIEEGKDVNSTDDNGMRKSSPLTTQVTPPS